MLRAIIYLVSGKQSNRKNRVCMHFQQVHCTCSQHHRDVCLGSTRSGPMFSKARQFLKSRMRRRDPPPPPPPPGTPPPGSDPPERRSRVRTTPNSFTCRFCQRVYRGKKNLNRHEKLSCKEARSRKRSYESPERAESAACSDAEQVGPRNLFSDFTSFNPSEEQDLRDEREGQPGAVDQGEACEGGSCSEEGGSCVEEGGSIEGDEGESSDEGDEEGSSDCEGEGDAIPIEVSDDERDSENEGFDPSGLHGDDWKGIYSRRVVNEPGFPTDNLAIGFLIAWDHIGRMISRRKMDRLLAILRDPLFKPGLTSQAFKNLTAKRLRSIAERFPLIATEQLQTTQTVTHKVHCVGKLLASNSYILGC